MSPGATLDKLWHYMLLNTTVSSQVHDLLGGVVEHRGIDHTYLLDDTKLLQRLYSMNVMRMEGHEPDVELWTEPGTAMHTVLLTTVPVPALRCLQHLQSLPGGGRLYVTPTLSTQMQNELVEALVLLYHNMSDNVAQPNAAAVQQVEANRRRTMQQADAASSVAAAAPKRARRAGDETQQQLGELSVTPPQGRPQQQQGQQKIHISIKDQLGDEVYFRVKMHASIAAVKKAYADKKSMDPDVLRFVFDAERMWEDRVIGDYRM